MCAHAHTYTHAHTRTHTHAHTHTHTCAACPLSDVACTARDAGARECETRAVREGFLEALALESLSDSDRKGAGFPDRKWECVRVSGDMPTSFTAEGLGLRPLTAG